MATYAIGDVQGCLEPLERLLDCVDYDGARDRLWFVGDLVNRGPDSLGTLRFVHGLGDDALTVLGNHDLHLLAVALAGRSLRSDDTLDEVLAAPDRDVLLTWLRNRPLIAADDRYVLVHAGLPPDWTVAEALAHGAELGAVLSGPAHTGFLASMYGARPDRWTPALTGQARWRYITNALTRIRYCAADGRLDFKEKRDPGAQAAHLTPWYAVPGRRSLGETPIVFGHWATLQQNSPLDRVHRVYHLDNGCVWGRELTALRLDDLVEFRVPARAPAP